MFAKRCFPRVSWRIADIDWPSCLSYFEFDYYDTVYNESTFKKTVKGPFQPRMEFELLNTQVPCDDEYAFITRVSCGMVDTGTSSGVSFDSRLGKHLAAMLVPTISVITFH